MYRYTPSHTGCPRTLRSELHASIPPVSPALSPALSPKPGDPTFDGLHRSARRETIAPSPQYRRPTVITSWGNITHISHITNMTALTALHYKLRSRRSHRQHATADTSLPAPDVSHSVSLPVPDFPSVLHPSPQNVVMVVFSVSSLRALTPTSTQLPGQCPCPVLLQSVNARAAVPPPLPPPPPRPFARHDTPQCPLLLTSHRGSKHSTAFRSWSLPSLPSVSQVSTGLQILAAVVPRTVSPSHTLYYTSRLTCLDLAVTRPCPHLCS